MKKFFVFILIGIMAFFDAIDDFTGTLLGEKRDI